MTELSIRVKQGVCHVNTIWSVAGQGDCRVFEADLRAKYAELAMMSGTTLYLGRGPATLHTEPTDKYTEVEVLGLPEGAEISGIISRYRLVIYVYVPRDDSTIIWEDQR